VIPLYTLVTPSHEVLRHRFFEPTLPDDVELRLTCHENKGAGHIGTWSFHRGVVRKCEVIVQAIRENWGNVFIWSDIDVQFFSPLSPWVEPAMQEHDIAFQIDAPGPSLCNGFFFCRANEDTLQLWQDTLELTRKSGNGAYDQEHMRDILWGGRKMKWGHLPPVFFGGGTFTGDLWQPDLDFPVPEQAVVHHANFTCGVPNKVRQFEYVQEKRQRNDFIALQSAYERFGGREKFRTPDAPIRSNQSDREPLFSGRRTPPMA
jgi:hypothetical protein